MIQYMKIYEMEVQYMLYALVYTCKSLKIEVGVEFL